jgi:hypothetical protein
LQEVLQKNLVGKLVQEKVEVELEIFQFLVMLVKKLEEIEARKKVVKCMTKQKKLLVDF